MTLLKAFKKGNIQPFYQKRLMFILWVINFVTAVLVSVPFYFIVESFAGYSLMGKELNGGISLLFITELINNHGHSIGTVIISILLTGIFYIAACIFMNGGAISLLVNNEKYKIIRKFFSAGGAFLGRFFRLFLFSLFMYVFICYFLIHKWIMSPLIKKTAMNVPGDASLVNMQIFEIILLILAFGFIAMIFDYAKIRTASEDEKSMIFSLLNSIVFVFRYFPQTVVLYMLISVEAIILTVLFFLFSTKLDFFQSIVALFILQQVFMFSRMWIKLNYFSGQLDLYRTLDFTEENA